MDRKNKKEVLKIVRENWAELDHEQLAEKLNSQGYSSPSGKPWGRQTVGKFVRASGLRKHKPPTKTRKNPPKKDNTTEILVMVQEVLSMKTMSDARKLAHIKIILGVGA